jgi:hypothetical protein
LKERLTVIIVMGNSLVRFGSELGPETVARCSAAVDAYRRMKAAGRNPRIFLGAGFAPKKLGYINQTKTMAEMMEDFFLHSGVSQRDIEIGPVGWGSFRELLAIVWTMHRFVRDTGSKIDRVCIVSSRYHLARCLKILRALFREDVYYALECPPVMYWKGALREIPFRALALLKIFERIRPGHNASKRPTFSFEEMQHYRRKAV